MPAKGQNRITAMVEGRPDWVLSRQRAWGVPITLFVHKESREILKDNTVNAAIMTPKRDPGIRKLHNAQPVTVRRKALP